MPTHRPDRVIEVPFNDAALLARLLDAERARLLAAGPDGVVHETRAQFDAELARLARVAAGLRVGHVAPKPDADLLAALEATLLAVGAAEHRRTGCALEYGKPRRWWDAPHWRCVYSHVSTAYLKSEALGGARCFACKGRLLLTFPEDVDGPLAVAPLKNFTPAVEVPR